MTKMNIKAHKQNTAKLLEGRTSVWA